MTKPVVHIESAESAGSLCGALYGQSNSWGHRDDTVVDDPEDATCTKCLSIDAMDQEDEGTTEVSEALDRAIEKFFIDRFEEKFHRMPTPVELGLMVDGYRVGLASGFAQI